MIRWLISLFVRKEPSLAHLLVAIHMNQVGRRTLG